MSKAIAYFSNGLGNLVMMMPALQAAASMTDSKTIDICLDDNWKDSRRPAVEDICRAWPVVDRIFSWPRGKFDEKEYDLWFYSPHGSNSDVVPIFLHNRRGKPIPKPNWRGSLIHESDHYAEIVRALGYERPIPKVQFPVADNPVLDFPRPIIGLCNGWFRTEQKYWAKKGWPHFEAIPAPLRRYLGGSIVGVGGRGELDSCILLDADFTGKLTILQTAKVLSQLDLLITTDTGPMHIANALDIPLIAMFGSTLIAKNAPRGKNASVLISGLECAQCQDTGAFYNCQQYACMESISVGDVMAEVRRKLE